METEAAVARTRRKKTAKKDIDFSLAVIRMQMIVCGVLLLTVVILRFVGGVVFDGVKQQCRDNIIGEFNFNEIVENTMAVFLSLSQNQEPQGQAAPAGAIVNSEPSDAGQTQNSPESSSSAASADASAKSVNVTFDEPELAIPQTIYVPGESPLESDFLNIGGEGQRILAGEVDLDEVIKGASLTEYPVAAQGVLPTTGRISSKFGFRDDPFTGERKFHGGMDIAAPIGTPVAAAYGGRVIESIESDTGYGNHVIIQHADGLITIYGHCSKLLVETGTVVRAGEIIAEVGSTGNSTGPHLHFEARINGIKVSPAFLVDTSPLKQG